MSLSAADAAVLDGLQTPIRRVARNRELISAGRRYDGLLVLIEGIALRTRILRDGRRQILNIAIPGDIIGFPACFFENALYSVSCLTDTTVAAVSFTELLALFEKHPRVSAAMFWSFSCEAAMYAEHLIDVGRRSSVERVGHFLLELLTRLRAVGMADGNSYHMPLTQELIADALGLSLQHVNRTLRQLRERRLIDLVAQTVVIRDPPALSALVDFDEAYLGRFRLAALPPGG